ncbi:hypothetical protein EOS93_25235 [Rhizobium sp. RMa-01]|uniref:hypothetical protein n=1 Tax=unclassified Rhizobium TaxID=2613769 RepID=UPI0008DA9BA2|nr:MULTISPECIES: hypothetical protein [unclassified Rhizobium]OHV24936.1 hypothetical protein BBJ66_22600 [Rhizobium sp. RSm-3]RVU08357.1 hypothetical protein EOS93_25235 [Rhizobium sp. RMa-01]
MCMFSSPKTSTAEVTPPVEYAQQKTPDYAAAEGTAARRATDKAKGATNTVLTSPTGTGALAPTSSPTLTGDKKTLLGA